MKKLLRAKRKAAKSLQGVHDGIAQFAMSFASQFFTTAHQVTDHIHTGILRHKPKALLLSEEEYKFPMSEQEVNDYFANRKESS